MRQIKTTLETRIIFFKNATDNDWGRALVNKVKGYPSFFGKTIKGYKEK